MLELKSLRILCSCQNEFELNDSNFTSIPKSSPFSIEPEHKKATFNCPNCGKPMEIEICYSRPATPDGIDDLLQASDLKITGDFQIIYSDVIIKPPSSGTVGKTRLQEFIDHSLTKFYDEFFIESQNKNFYENNKCILNFTFQKNATNEIDYSKKNLQQLYQLYYFYAYLLEYKNLYSQINLDNYFIFSIGCGSFLDYYGFRHAKNDDTPHHYYGLDCNNWRYRDLITHGNGIIFFSKQTLSQCLSHFHIKGFDKTLGVFNVFIFPKTIEYLEDGKNGIHEITMLADAIENTTFKHDKIYLILNGMDNDIDDDEKKLDIVIKAFQKIGFNIKEPIIKFDGDDKGMNIVCGDSSLQYPPKIDSRLQNICTLCSNNSTCTLKGNLKNRPMLKAKYFKYRIVKLEK